MSDEQRAQPSLGGIPRAHPHGTSAAGTHERNRKDARAPPVLYIMS